MDDDTVLGWLFNLGDADGTLIAVRLVESSQLLEGVFAGDIGVQDEEGGVIFAEDVGSQLQGTGSSQRLRLDGESDLDAEFLLVLYSAMLSVVLIDNLGVAFGMLVAQGWTQGSIMYLYTDLFQVSLHNLGAVVDSQHHIGDTSLGKGLNLVLDHGLVGKLDKGFGKS